MASSGLSLLRLCVSNQFTFLVRGRQTRRLNGKSVKLTNNMTVYEVDVSFQISRENKIFTFDPSVKLDLFFFSKMCQS